MLDERGRIKENLLRSYCVVAPDSSIILSHVFGQESHKTKVESFVKDIHQLRIACEVLPQVEREIMRKLSFASGEYVNILNRCRVLMQTITHTELSKLNVDKDIVESIEKAFMGIMAETERRDCKSAVGKVNALDAVRIVETTVMLKIREDLQKVISLAQFFNEIEDGFGKKVEEFCQSKMDFIKELGASSVKENELPPKSEKLRELFQKKCAISRPLDVELLCQATGRMYSADQWYAVVSIDYTHMVNNRLMIDQCTLLTVTDPLYFIFHLDRKVNTSLNPSDLAKKRGIPYRSFIDAATPSYIS